MSRKLANWLDTYMQYTSQSEAPEAFHFWTGISTIAGTLRRNVWINQLYFDWTPNFYIILVAPPGVATKSTCIDIGARLLREVPGVVFGPDVVTWQALVSTLTNASTDVLDTSSGEIIQVSCINLISRELGNLFNPHDREMVDLFVALWDGQMGDFTKVTKGGGEEVVENPWVNILAATTPSWIAGYMPEYMIGGGFTSRCIFVYADKKRRLVAYPKLEAAARGVQSYRYDLIADLCHISTLTGEYTLTPAAIDWGIAWYEKFHATDHVLDEKKFGGYISRKQAMMHKLAMVLAAAQRDQLEIFPEDLIQAESILRSLETDVEKVYAMIGRTAQAKSAEAIADLLMKKKMIERSHLYRELYKHFSASEIEAGIKAVCEADVGVMKAHQGRIYLVLASALKSVQPPKASS